MKNALRKVIHLNRQDVLNLGKVGLMALGFTAAQAQAAIDAAVGTAFTAIQTDAVALSAIVTPIIVSILGLVIVIKLIKRFGNKL